MSSSVEAETHGTFNNGKTAIGMKPALIPLDHKKPVTPLKTDNSTTEGFVNSGIKPKRSKTWDIKWHWLREKEDLEKLRVCWYKGKNNDVDYFTKHHPPIHHCQIRTWYIHTLYLLRTIPQTIRLCDGVLNQVPGTQSCIEYLKLIRERPQFRTDKCHTVRRLNCPRQIIM